VSGRYSYLVGAGILLSRIAGLVRQRVLAHYLGLGDFADALFAAFRIPNFLQNLFGEGALSASFIPSYAKLLGEERDEEARRLAGAILALLTLAVSVIVVLGILTTPWIVRALEPAWPATKQALTTRLVRILFPGVGLLVVSAWCLGVLNSHRRFLVSYASPVIWNVTIIAAILLAPRDLERVVLWTAWGAVLGSILQVAVQWPVVRSVAGQIQLRAWRGVTGVGTVARTFLPAVISRGAAQISSFVDLAIAGLLPAGAIAAMTNAQVLYTLPVSLFGMAISAAELPEMARERGDAATVAAALRVRLDAATQRLAYYIVPSAMAMFAIGGVLAAAIYQTGRFGADDARYVWLILAGSAFGLLAATLGRLYSSAFYAIQDAVTPLRAGLLRIALTAGLGLFGALVLPGWLGVPASWGAAGLTLSAGLAGWVEFLVLRRALCRRLGRFALPFIELAKLWGAAVLAAGVATGVRLLTMEFGPLGQGAVVIPAYGVTYLGMTWLFDIPESAVLAGRVLGRLRTRR
jgi:putative peptidoglycan lipid II flippase